MPQSFASLHVHLVFSTKHRQPFLSDDLRPRLFEYIGGIARQNDGVLVSAGGTEDHVHLLTSLGRSNSVADAVRLIKTNTSGWIHDEFRELREFQWQQGYGAFAVSFSNIDSVKQYLANQEEHHRKRTYQDEFRELLRRHGIDWDERYVWD
ncbi:MAG TPA: IS200/IS605 family transposase [Lacipirellula sp.]